MFQVYDDQIVSIMLQHFIRESRKARRVAGRTLAPQSARYLEQGLLRCNLGAIDRPIIRSNYARCCATTHQIIPSILR